MASHELRTPLTAISGFADTLTHRWETLPEEQRLGFVQIIQEQSERLVRLINDVLTVSRLERGALAVEARPISLLQLITRVAEGVGFADVHVSCAAELSAFSDPDHLQQVLINYLANAHKYGAYPIQVYASSDADWVTIEVRDHGQGVPADFRARLFDRFTQAALRPEGGGTGLGLSIVQGLAAAQGGARMVRTQSSHRLPILRAGTGDYRPNLRQLAPPELP